MDNARIKISSVVTSQLPSFVRENFPLAEEFLKQYYRSLDYQSGVYDILQNIDKDIKVDNSSNQIQSTVLTENVTFFDTTISVTSTLGFPDTYGLIKIDDEVILYQNKTETTFENCSRGFSAITSYGNGVEENFVFEDTLVSQHTVGTEQKPTLVLNLSILFLEQYYKKTKKQFLPGFEGRKFFSSLNSATFLKNSKDFYSSKGTDESFKILFKVLFGANVDVIKPREYLIQASDAQYRKTRDLVVERISGNILQLNNKTIFQDEQGYINKAFGTVTDVEAIFRDGTEYFVLKLDNDFNRDINVIGTVFGDFSIHPKTKIVENVSISGNSILVDSTLGFPDSGTLIYKGAANSFLISYTEKTLTQFNNCTGITEELTSGSDISLNVYAYGFSPNNEEIRFRITGVISDCNLVGKGKKFLPGDPITLAYYGYNDNTDFIANNWLYNVSVDCEVKSFENNGGFYFTITTFDNNNIKNQDIVEVDYLSNLTGRKTRKFQALVSDGNIPNRQFTINKVGEPIDKIFSIRKVISQYNGDQFPSDVVNTYKQVDKNELYVASNSFPNYGDSVIEIDDFKTEFSEVIDNYTVFAPKHGFITGDAVLYTYTEDATQTLIIQQGIYYVKYISESLFKLSRSKENIEKSNILNNNSGYVKLLSSSEESSGRKGYTNNFISLLKFANKNLKPDQIGSQKLIRKIERPKPSQNKVKTVSGCTGIFVNGVELLNYKSNDIVYYGEIESVKVVGPGENYSVNNPPNLIISSNIGNSAFGYCGVEGSLSRIDIIDPGYDYIEDPIVNISGGSGTGAKAKANLIPVDNSLDFDSTSNNTRINLVANQIGFSTFHRLNNGEIITYSTNNQTTIGGLVDKSSYFVKVVDDFTVKLFRSLDNAIDDTNAIDITSYGQGNHTITSKNKKFTIGSISVISSGSGYKNNKITINPTGVNTAFNQIEVYYHPYQSGEIITYDSEGTTISGVGTGSYYVTRTSDTTFKLSQIGIGTIAKDFYYKTQQYVNFSDQGSGKHVFNYEPINVSVSGYVGVSTANQKTFNSILRPVFRGSVSSVYVENGGVGYGSSEIINYNRQPQFTLDSGSGAEVIPVISDGSIREVLVVNSGSGYTEPPDIVISGTGIGAVLTPIIEDGKLKSVNVIYGGYSYVKDKTTIRLESVGTGCQLKAEIKKWNINNYERLLRSNKIGSKDGVIYKGLNPKYGLQYTHLYTPRELRKRVSTKSTENNETVYRSDYTNDKSDTKFHSPILGWAYDGNPIYGPYGYESLDSKRVVQVKSSYDEPVDNTPGRPSSLNYPKGFFIEDYPYTGGGDLDENNGRFCITPEFPKGTYAYFTTIGETDVRLNTSDGRGLFNNDREPKFPYVVGNSYNSKPIDFNFNLGSNQDDFDLSDSSLIRNTYPYNSDSKFSEYKFVGNTNKNYKVRNSKIKSTFESGISRILPISGGDNYRVGEFVDFDNAGTSGSGARFKVSQLRGKPIQKIDLDVLSLDNLEFTSYRGSSKIIGFSTSPISLKSNQIVKVESLEKPIIKGKFAVKIPQNTLILTNDALAAPGVNYLEVDGGLTYPNIKENDVYTLDNEKIKVLNIEPKSSRIRVLRGFDSTGVTSHFASTVLTENSNKIILDYPSENFNYKINSEYYFDPTESIGFGTERTKVVFANPGAGVTTLTFNPRSIYLNNNKLQTGNLVEYTSNGSPIGVSTDGVNIFTINDGDRFYVTKLSDNFIGISTDKVGLNTFGEYTNSDFTVGLLYFNSSGIGSYHSLKTVYEETLLVNIEKNSAIVSTASTHNLSVNDLVNINISSGITTTYKVKYNDFYRRIIVGEVSFDSLSVDIDLNTIRIPLHNYTNGQKVIYNSSSPSLGLVDNQIYYVNVYDKNRIRLCDSKYQATKLISEYVKINSAESGTLSPINPPIKIVRNGTIIFDVSDKSLSIDSPTSGRIPSFDFNLYQDSSLSNLLFIVDSNGNSQITKNGSVGLNGATVQVNLNSSLPDTLFYSLDPIENNTNLSIKKEIKVDSEVESNNSIKIRNSAFSGPKVISAVGMGTVGLTSFTYEVENSLEVIPYNQTNSSISYTTSSKTEKGPIAGFERLSSGEGYFSFPFINGVISEEGTNAILVPESDDIGSVKSSEIVDMGYNYSIDKTLRPFARLPQIFKVEPLSKIANVGVTSIGVNYNSAPDLVVIDSFTNKVVNDLILDLNLEKSEVVVIKNTKGFYNNIPKIIPTNNTNGIKISNITYDSGNKDVTVTLDTNFSAEDLPFEVNDKIIVEGISITGSGTGYNSKNYTYALFKIIAIDLSGVLPKIKYSLKEYLGATQTPGTFDPANSAGVITPEKYFPQFDISLEKNNFSVRETVRYGNKTGKVVQWDSKNEVLKIQTEFKYEGESTIEGTSSNASAFIRRNVSEDTYYLIDSSSISIGSWNTDTGFLNNSIQKIADNNYYQYFSYSLKSEIPISEWDLAVNDLNHTSGFRRFSDLQVISTTDEFSGISTVQRPDALGIVVDLNSQVDVNCVFDFDLVSENYFFIDDTLSSDEIYLDSRVIQDYSESIGNRVLVIDDISDEFNTSLPATFVTSFNI
jgi:hypothetical protein